MKHTPQQNACDALAETLRLEIFRSGLTIRALSDRTGVAYSTIDHFARGNTRWPRPSTLLPLMAYFGVDLQTVRRKKT